MKLIHCYGTHWNKDLNYLFRSFGWNVNTSNFESGKEIIEILEKEHFDIITVMIKLPDMDALELMKIVNERWPKLPVVILSDRRSRVFGLHCLKLGAAAYLTENDPIYEYKNTFKTVLMGKAYVSESLQLFLDSRKKK